MTLAIIILILGYWFTRNMVDDDTALHARYQFIYNFISIYEKQTGVRLTYEQAIALIQVTIATMAKSPRDKVYLDDQYPKAQRVVNQLCTEAENKVLNNHLNEN